MPLHQVGVLRGFGLKTGIHYAHWSGIGYGFLKELQDCMSVFIVSIPNEYKNERKRCEFEMVLKNFFVCALI